MSFSLTTEQIRNKTKTVTRRLGWANLKVGDRLQPIEKGLGLKKGETVKKIGAPVTVINVRQEQLYRIMHYDCLLEGFPNLTPFEFVDMFCRHNKCQRISMVTRIEFKY